MKLRRFLIVALCAFIAAFFVTFAVRKIGTFGPISGHTAPLAKQVPALVRSLRPNYPYSVIPGGAYSAAELRYVDKNDPIVRDHYADFDIRAVRLVQLTEDRYQYVSYRLHNKIYWTHKKLRIPRGEYLLTDGHTYARARCGNRLSDNSHRQTCPQEPTASALSLPPLGLQNLPNLQLAEAPPPGELTQEFPVLPNPAERLAPVLPNGALATIPAETPPTPTTYVPIAPFFPPSLPSPGGVYLPPSRLPPPVSFPGIPLPVPEPSSIYLFVITFLVSLWGLTRMIPKKDEPDNSD
ncbi:MAG TPA: hypothetical protein VGL97_20415 [Bryobacteraceae bacterium]